MPLFFYAFLKCLSFLQLPLIPSPVDFETTFLAILNFQPPNLAHFFVEISGDKLPNLVLMPVYLVWLCGLDLGPQTSICLRS